MSYKQFVPEDIIVSSDSIVAPCWSNYNTTLSNVFTSSIQAGAASGDYFLNVYNKNPLSDNTSEIQFSVAFGNREGSGSIAYSSAYPGLSPSRTVYGQWRNLIYGDENSNFEFGGITPFSQSIYVISIDRARYKQALQPGSLNLELYGAGVTRSLTDNSNDIETVTYCDAGRVYLLVSGSDGTAVQGTFTGESIGMTRSGSYGLVLPDVGAIILNAAALKLTPANGGITLNFNSSSNSDSPYNPGLLFNALIDQAVSTPSSASSFQLNSQETITSDFVFCRARNGEFNYSENPSFISGSTGAVLYDLFINSPTTYITTVGLYNNSNELLAVAKLSTPLKKDFTKEALIRVKLDF
jgi:hypothetical protein